MDFPVHIGEGVSGLSESALSPSGNPLLDAARAEHQALSSPDHPDHAAYWRGDATVHARLDGLYEKAFQQTSAPHGASHEPAPFIPREGAVFTTSVDGAERMQQAHADALAALKQEFGEEFALDIPQDAAAIQANLQQEWGGEFESRWAGALNLGNQLFQRNPQLAWEATALLGDARGIRLLDAIRQTMNQYRT